MQIRFSVGLLALMGDLLLLFASLNIFEILVVQWICLLHDS